MFFFSEAFPYVRSRSKKNSTGQKRDKILVLIALFKFFKCFLFIGVGIGLFSFLHRNLFSFLMDWVDLLRIDPKNGLVYKLLEKATWLNSFKIKILGTGSLIYAILFFVEGIGLWMQKRWAEYLTVIITASLVPFEIYELAKKPNWPKETVLAVNLVTVVYLVFRLVSLKPKKKR